MCVSLALVVSVISMSSSDASSDCPCRRWLQIDISLGNRFIVLLIEDALFFWGGKKIQFVVNNF